MKVSIIQEIIQEYLKKYPQESDRLGILQNYLKKAKDEEITDWNNVKGHITAGGFVYCEENQKFLVLYHKDLQMYLYPGGHCEKENDSPLETSRNEVFEETGIAKNLLQCKTKSPFDIDTHIIPFNKRVNMPEHYHFDFRYLFVIKDMIDIKIDENEMSNYVWVDFSQIVDDKNFGSVAEKLAEILNIKQEKHS